MSAQPPDLPGPWPDILAAYADGELAPEARDAVKRKLAANPAAAAEVRNQRELSPANWPLWQQAEPLMPTEAAWAAVREAVAGAVLPRPASPADRREWNWWARAGVHFAGGVAAAVAAMVLIALIGRLVKGPPQQPVPLKEQPVEVADGTPTADPLADFPVLPLATDADVDIRRVAGDGAAWLPVGAHPLPGPLALATEDDVELEDAAPHPAWPAGTPRMTTAPGDAPIIFAANPR